MTEKPKGWFPLTLWSLCLCYVYVCFLNQASETYGFLSTLAPCQALEPPAWRPQSLLRRCLQTWGWANGAYPPVVKAGFGKSHEIPQHLVLLMGRSTINGGCSMDDPISSIGGWPCRCVWFVKKSNIHSKWGSPSSNQTWWSTFMVGVPYLCQFLGNGKSPCTSDVSMGKINSKWWIFHCYVWVPEGMWMFIGV